MKNTLKRLTKACRDTLTFAKRSLLKIYHNPEKLFDVTFTPVLFTLMFAYLFGGAIAGDMKNYLPTLIPGILVQSFLQRHLRLAYKCGKTLKKVCSTVSNHYQSYVSHLLPDHWLLILYVIYYVQDSSWALVLF